MPYKIQIKAFSTNRMYRGVKKKSYDYLKWQKIMLESLTDMEIPEGQLALTVEVGLSSMGGDLDNFAGKAFIDTLSKRYGFNDNRLYSISMSKVKVKKGQEYIKFKISKYEDRS